jgi:hypothetical protein
MLTRLSKWSLVGVLTTLVLCTTGIAQNCNTTVAQGSDYFQTVPTTAFNFGPGIGNVNFAGSPIGPGNTDTIVQRQADAFIDCGPIPIQLVALSLASTAPVKVGNTFYNVSVGLNPDIASTGQMMIVGSLLGGTFSSSFNVSFDAHFAPLGTGQPFDVFDTILLSNSGSPWSPTAPPGALHVYGLYGNQFANTHIGLPANEVDFWPCWDGAKFNPCVETHFSGPGTHTVVPTLPEPSTLLLLGPAGFGLLWKLRVRRSARV